MHTTRRVLVLTFALGAPAAAAAQAVNEQIAVAIAPFDMIDVDRGSRDIGQGLAKLVRVEMLKQRRLRPVLLEVPEETELPLSTEAALELGRKAQAALVVVGTVLEADVSQSDSRASTGGAFGIDVGGSVRRTAARVTLHVELVDVASGRSSGTFEVEGTKTETGVGADFSTTIGSFDTGQSDWENTAMGKAVREAAERLAREVSRRSASLKR